jgi:putative salt-induced outer membrane protein YdiY
MPRQSAAAREKTMTTIMKILPLAAAAILLAGAVGAHAQTTTITQTNTTTQTNTVIQTNATTGAITTTRTITIVQTITTLTNAPLTNALATSTNQPRGSAALAHGKVIPTTNTWKTSVSVGVTVARGNTDTTLASFTANTEKKWDKNDLVFGADGLYGETKDPNQTKYTESAEVLHGFSQYNRTLAYGFYGYGRIDGFHDGIADIKYRLTLAPGLGYFFVTNKIVDFSAEIGPGYIKEQLDGDSRSFATLRIGEKLHYAISPHAKVWEAVEFLPQVNEFDNYLVNSEVGIETSLSKNNRLSLRSVLQDSYNNIPAAGRLKNDLKLITSVAYKF